VVKNGQRVTMLPHYPHTCSTQHQWRNQSEHSAEANYHLGERRSASVYGGLGLCPLVKLTKMKEIRAEFHTNMYCIYNLVTPTFGSISKCVLDSLTNLQTGS